MSWLKLDDKFARHPKIAGLPDRAFRLHVTAMLYASEYRTDGHVPTASLPTLRAGRAAICSLVDAGLWHSDGDGYQIHDFEEYNPKDTNAERQARYRRKHRNGESNSESNVTSNSDVTASRVDARARPVPYPSLKPIGRSEEAEERPVDNSKEDAA